MKHRVGEDPIILAWLAQRMDGWISMPRKEGQRSTGKEQTWRLVTMVSNTRQTLLNRHRERERKELARAIEMRLVEVFSTLTSVGCLSELRSDWLFARKSVFLLLLSVHFLADLHWSIVENRSVGNVINILQSVKKKSLPRMKVIVRSAFLARFCDLDFLRFEDFWLWTNSFTLDFVDIEPRFAVGVVPTPSVATDGRLWPSVAGPFFSGSADQLNWSLESSWVITHWSFVFGDDGNDVWVIKLSNVTFETIRLLIANECASWTNVSELSFFSNGPRSEFFDSPLFFRWSDLQERKDRKTERQVLFTRRT